MRRYSPYRISAFVLVVTARAAARRRRRRSSATQDYADLGWEVWALLAFAVVGPLVLTNVLWFKAIDRVGPSHATLFANLQPFVAVIFAVLLLSRDADRAADRGRRRDRRSASWLGADDQRACAWCPAANDRRCASGSRARRRATAFSIGRVLAIYAGLMVALLLAALDQTIVATALPRIVTDLGGLTSYSWVFTAYMLASTVTVPLYGKLGDVHGRRPLLLISISIFLVGSALCGLAQNMPELVVFRADPGPRRRRALPARARRRSA